MKFWKIYKDSYMRAAIVLAIDVAVSLMASVCLLMFCLILVKGVLFPSRLLASWVIGSFGSSVISFYATRIYRSVIRYSTLWETGQVCVAVLFKELLLFIVSLIFLYDSYGLTKIAALAGLDFLVTFSAMLIVRVMMVATYRLLTRTESSKKNSNRVLIYGDGEMSVSLATQLRNSSAYDVAGFISYGYMSHGTVLNGLPVYGFHNAKDISALCRSLGLTGVLFPHYIDARNEQNRLMEYANKADMKLFVLPSIDEIAKDKPLARSIRKIRIEDLLGRSEIKISMKEIYDDFKGKVVLVTGAAGSIGSELCRQLRRLGISRLIMLDNAETPLYNVRLGFEDQSDASDSEFIPIIADVRDKNTIDSIFNRYRPQIVFHAAAYKHVPLMEENPCEAVKVNVVGSRIVADACVKYGVGKMILVSTDKAVNPTNIMGCTKRLAEIYVQSYGLELERQGERKTDSTVFVTTRFGNVLGSQGSVIPRFSEQIAKGGPVTVTDPEICRYFMTIPEACRLVMEAAVMAKETRIFVFDMGKPVKIADLAKSMINLAGFEVDKDIKIEYIGLRPGEKLYEEVLADRELTIPTDNDRIFEAKVRQYSYGEICDVTANLKTLAYGRDVSDMVTLMKKTVPEFKSRNSEFEKYDIQK